MLYLFEFIIVLVLSSYVIAYLGKNRKLGFWGYFIASLLLTPLIGLLLLLASDERPHKS